MGRKIMNMGKFKKKVKMPLYLKFKQDDAKITRKASVDPFKGIHDQMITVFPLSKTAEENMVVTQKKVRLRDKQLKQAVDFK